jgi:hypothetical protein
MGKYEYKGKDRGESKVNYPAHQPNRIGYNVLIIYRHPLSFRP